MTNNRPLEAARVDLGERCQRADNAGDVVEHRLLESLYDVAGMICEIGDADDSNYRAERAGSLVTSALQARCAALEKVAGAEDDEHKELSQALSQALRLEREVDDEINKVMWVIARHRRGGVPLWRSDVMGLRRAVQRLSRWADQVAARPYRIPSAEGLVR
jgi:hypothetical protein